MSVCTCVCLCVCFYKTKEGAGTGFLYPPRQINEISQIKISKNTQFREIIKIHEKVTK